MPVERFRSGKPIALPTIHRCFCQATDEFRRFDHAGQQITGNFRYEYSAGYDAFNQQRSANQCYAEHHFWRGRCTGFEQLDIRVHSNRRRGVASDARCQRRDGAWTDTALASGRLFHPGTDQLHSIHEHERADNKARGYSVGW